MDNERTVSSEPNRAGVTTVTYLLRVPLLPHAFWAITETLPLTTPKSIVTDVEAVISGLPVEEPSSMTQPDGAAQRYEVAPKTAVIL